MSGSYIFASLNSRLESDKEEEEDWRLGIDHPALIGGWGLGMGDRSAGYSGFGIWGWRLVLDYLGFRVLGQTQDLLVWCGVVCGVGWGGV